METKTTLHIRVVLLMGLAGSSAYAAEPVPYGSKDFYPSAERPIGYFGNGNGAYPGATPVTEWTDAECFDAQDGRKKATRNIVWRNDLPGWSSSSPVVVGDRIFVTCEPNTLVCTDANTGNILWQQDVNSFECMGQTGEEARVRQEILEMGRAFRHLLAYCGTISSDRTQVVREMVLPKLNGWLGILEKTEPSLVPAMQEAIKRFTDDPNTKVRKDNFDGPGRFHDAVWAKYLIPTAQLWEGHHGDTYATPVSDGKHVYVSMAQGQAACYDLNGKRIWAKFFEQNISDIGCYDCASPRLSTGVLVVVHYDHYRGLDARTGEVIWKFKVKRRLDPQTPGTYAVLDLPKDGGIDPVVVTTVGTINRVKDGAELADLGYRMGWDGGSMSVLGEKNYALIQPGGKGISAAAVAAIFLEWNEGKLKVSPYVFLEGLAPHGRTPTLYNGRAYDNCIVWDVQTGRVLARGGIKREESHGFYYDWPSAIIAGSYLIGPTDGRNCRAPRGPTGKQVSPCGVVKLNGEDAPTLVSAPNLIGSTKWAKARFVEKYLPELCAPGKEWRNPNFGMYQRYGFAHYTALGNRLFYRTPSHLYCIGDPSTPYDWNPKSRPADVTKGLSLSGAPTL
jgi:hypothetical protein